LNIKTCEKKEKSTAEFIVEVSQEEFEAALSKAFIKNRNRISVPGFRKGKAPRKIIERMYGASVFHPDALEMLAPDALKTVEEGSELRLAGRPGIADFEVRDGGEGAEITVSASLYPEVKLGEYKGLSAIRPDTEVPESVVDAEVAEVRLRNARIEKVDRPAIDGDVAIIDFEGFVDGEPFEGGKAENHELELGSNSFIPGFEEKLLGMSAGEERDIDLQFPEDYAEHLAGKPVVFKVKLNELREKQMPELDDEFAKDVSEFDTLKEYKDDIRGKLEKSKLADSDAAFENALVDKIVDAMEAEIPDSMIDEQQEITTRNVLGQISSYGIKPEKYLQMMNMTPEMFRDSMRLKSENQVKVTLALEKIAELEGIEVSDEDIDNEYKEAATRYDVELDKIKESVKEKDIILDIKLRRAAKVVTENAVAASEEPVVESPTAVKKPAAKPKKAPAKKTAAKNKEGDETK